MRLAGLLDWPIGPSRKALENVMRPENHSVADPRPSQRGRIPIGEASSLRARQQQLLQLLDALGGSMGSADFQKLLFLYCQEAGSGRPYDFVPYRFGAFSFLSYADRRKLIQAGFLVDTNDRWELSDEGRRIIEGRTDVWIAAFVQSHASLRGDALIADTYRRFPYYATRSEIARRVLQGDRDALARIDAERPRAGPAAVLTIGYEGHTLESYLNVLLNAGVSVLCDVRRNPISRKYGFSKGTLSGGCEGVGIRYEHLPELGIASAQRQDLNTQDDYDALFAEYERAWLPKHTKALSTIQGWIRGGARVALTCYEHLPQQCHRHCVAEALEAHYGKDFKARHL